MYNIYKNTKLKLLKLTPPSGKIKYGKPNTYGRVISTSSTETIYKETF